MRVIVAPVLLFALAACSSPPETQVAGQERQVCVREAATGSTITVTRCRSAEQVEREREAAAAATADIRRTVPESAVGRGLP